MWWIRRILRGDPEARSFRTTADHPPDRLRQIAVGAVVALLALIAMLWISDPPVDVVLVNASGRPLTFAWQPNRFGPMVEAVYEPCHSTSQVLEAGAQWRVTLDGTPIVGSDNFSLPRFTGLVAIEARIESDGSVQMVGPHPVARPLDAPIVACPELG